jgi:NAD-dependent deacetylase
MGGIDRQSGCLGDDVAGCTSDIPSPVIGLIRDAERTLFITGAGISADSGLPTYRGVGGLYETTHTEEGIPIEVALSGTMLTLRPELAWKYLWQIGSACAGATFNRGHEVIAAIEQARPATWVLTQNVDGFHRAAGSRNLIEVHGRIGELFCVQCAERFTAGELIAGFAGSAGPPPLPPQCPTCGGLIRPDVVLFGEMLPMAAVQQMAELAGMRWDLVIVVGTTGVFPYIAEPVMRASAAGVPTVEINPARTELSELVEYRIEGRAAAALERLWGEGTKARRHEGTK